jgi:hypothetical protein
MQMRLKGLLILFALVLSACQETVSPPSSREMPTPAFVKAPTGDAAVIAKMEQINRQLKKRKLNISVEAIEFFTIGGGRPTNRIHQTPFRWVPNDPRRAADGDNITYLVDQSDGATASGLTSAQTEAALDRALGTWNTDESCLSNVDIVKRADTGADPDIFDSFYGFGRYGNPFLADITQAGWLPRAYFEAVGGPGGGDGILAFSVTFVFDNPDGSVTDINGDNYLDTALNEVYYNDNFGDPKAPPRVLPDGTIDEDGRESNPWGIDIALPGIDVETVGLHENGHSLELGHFGPEPVAVMNPVYAGIRHSPFPSDHSGMCAVWASWPNP